MSTIDTLEAGRELDALVAEKVMGWQWMNFCRGNFLFPPAIAEGLANRPGIGWVKGYQKSDIDDDIEFDSLPEFKHASCSRYSTDIGAAWQVIDALGIKWTLCTMAGGRQCNRAIVFLPSSPTMSDVGAECEVTIYEKGKMPLAICLAALKAVDATPAERRVQYRESPAPPYVQAEIDRGLKLGKKAAEISERKKGGCEPQQ